ncbi:MAG: hypothetical protein IPO90_14240 [Flavobacteriales bacterium]|nr:hypothetical protein [Flavobacteriales bacterium]
MAKRKARGLSFEIDKLTRSIEEVATGESFPTLMLPLTVTDLKRVTKKNGWLFNWKTEFMTAGRSTYKLVMVAEPDMVHGLVCFEVKEDHVVMHLVESAPINKGKGKKYDGVFGNLVAFGCKLAFEAGHAGNLGFLAKTKLVQHYIDKLGAVHVGGNRMVINTPAARYLVDQYFPT